MSTRDISCNLGENVTGIGYQLLTDPGVDVGTRVTTGIFNPRPGVYIARGVDTTGATNVHWDNAAGDVFADDVFETNPVPGVAGDVGGNILGNLQGNVEGDIEATVDANVQVIAGQLVAVTGSGTITFQVGATVATTTNITAGTITNVMNVPAVTLAATQVLYAPAKAGDAMTLTSAYDAAKTAAQAATALSTVIWTNTKAGYLDAAISTTGKNTPTEIRAAIGMSAADLDDQLDAILAAASTGDAGLDGPSAVTLTFRDTEGDPVPLVDFLVEGQGVGRSLVSGTSSFGLDDGNYFVVARAQGILFPRMPLAVMGASSLTIIGMTVQPSAPVIAVPRPNGVQSW